MNKEIDTLKEKGNEAFKKGEHSLAIELYSKALEISKNHIILANRSACFLALGKFYEAIDDADESIAINTNYSKSHVRKGLALRELHRFEEALESFQVASKIEPNNQQIHQEIQKIQKIINDKLPTYTVNELEQLPVLDHRSIAGDYYQMTYITFSQFEVMLKDILICTFGDRIALIKEIFKVIYQNAQNYKKYVIETIEKKVVDEIYPLFEPFQRKIDKQELGNTLLKFCVEKPPLDDEKDQFHNSKYLLDKIDQIVSQFKPKIEKYQINVKHNDDFKQAISSIFMDLCWLVLRMYAASPKAEFFDYEGEEYDFKKCEILEGCKKGNVLFTVYPGYKTSDKIFLNPIVFTD